MCQSAPARVTRIEGDVAWVETQRGLARVSLAAVEGVEVGDYVLYHAGLALQRLDAEEAASTLALLAEIEAFAAQP
jgi:hydrogenase expression/formation protein HypC